MLNRTFIVPYARQPDTRPFDEIVGTVKTAPEEALTAIISLDSYSKGSLTKLTDAVAACSGGSIFSRKKIKPYVEQLVYEALLKVAGFEDHLRGILHGHGFNDAHEVISRMSGTGEHDDAPNKKNAIVQMAVARTSKGALTDSIVDILAFVIAATYGEQATAYSGPIEIYYVITHIFSTYRNSTTAENILAWARHAQPMKSLLLYVECSAFFFNELRYNRDVALLREVIVLRKSHRLLLCRLRLLQKHFQWHTDLNGDAAKQLLDLLVASYRRDNTSHTEAILSHLQHEGLTKSFIKQTGYQTALFYRICHRIDEDYAEALTCSLDFFDQINDEDLAAFASSPFLYYATQRTKDFKAIVAELARRGTPFLVERLFRDKGPQRRKRQKGARAKDERENKQKQPDGLTGSLRNEKCTDIKKLEFLASKGIGIPRAVFLSSMDNDDRGTTVDIFFLLKDPGLIKAVYAFDKQLFLERLAGITEYSLFYIKCVNHLVKMGDSTAQLSINSDNSVYGAALRKSIRRGRAASVLAGDESVSTDQTRSPAALADAELEDGLLFHNGCLRVHNDNHRFTMRGHFTIAYTKSTNILFRFSREAFVFVKAGAVYFQKDTLGAVPILAIRSKPDHAETAAQADAAAAPGASTVAETPKSTERLYLNVKCVYNGKAISIAINGHEHTTALGRIEEIKIDEQFSGWLSNFVYYQSNAPFKFSECKSDVEYYRSNVSPLQRLLKYKQRHGLLMNSAQPFMLNGKVAVECRNIVAHRQAAQVLEC
ncbi:hypothetical protein PAPHI01_0957 [Pancytospora philotis]|nr:hypothetical protein PAPHI01_0957 [Pancytospora philotis]